MKNDIFHVISIALPLEMPAGISMQFVSMASRCPELDIEHYMGCAKQLNSMWECNCPISRTMRITKPSPVVPPRCDCGGAKARTTHAHWCSTTQK